jgi:hypothetical protein
MNWRIPPALAALVAPFACGSDGGAAMDSTSSSSESSSSESSSSSSDEGPTAPAECVAVGWDDSAAKFAELLELNSGAYWYSTTQVVSDSIAAVCTYKTSVSFVDGVPTRRRFEGPTWFGDPNHMPDPEGVCYEVEFDESDAAAVGSTASDFAAQPRPLDQLYDACCTEVLSLAPEQYNVTFTTFDNGLMRFCRAYEADCVENCWHGAADWGPIEIDELGFGPLPG